MQGQEQKQPGQDFLSARGIHKRFGALAVIENLDFSMRDGEAVGIVGPNGAGKTTLLGALAGAFPLNAGTITFDGRNVTALTAADRCRSGLVRTHQIPKPFGGMTTFENVLVAASHGKASTCDEAYERVVDSLRLCGMLGVANRRADTLGLLDRKRLELARALATGPRLLLVDEIGGGLSDGEATELVGTIQELRRRGIGIVWIEHIVHILLQVVERLICMDAGKIIADGDPKAVMNNAEVVRAYLGGAPA
ncbi:ABC transporter ATP-binding protein [Rhizobium sp. SYY.PMSO]|uniref:ABC transporter ATP-binding protein n=1 Tax=Rhizobium sp. SYY.PMSO TaxID=3382192 RepID=UPI0039900491